MLRQYQVKKVEYGLIRCKSIERKFILVNSCQYFEKFAQLNIRLCRDEESFKF